MAVCPKPPTSAAIPSLAEGLEPVPGYRLIRLRGKGAQGQVWEAYDPNGLRVALKFLGCQNQPPGLVSNEIRLLHNLQELHHPHLVTVNNIFTSPHYVIICMELADGNLYELRQAYLEETGAMIPPDHLVSLLDQAAEALDFLAGQRLSYGGFAPTGLQHCDIKPNNLLMVGDCLKVADLGVCSQQRSNSRRRTTGSTPPYAAPEMYEGRLTERTDQFALAVTYVELRTGQRPFGGEEPASAFRPTLVRDLRLLPPAERPIVSRALRHKWYDRWPTCREFIAALGAVAGKDPCYPADRPRPARSI